MRGGIVSFSESRTQKSFVIIINNCTDLGNCLDPVNTYTGYKDISVYRNSFDALSTTLYTYLVSTCLFDILSPTSGNTAAATGTSY